MNTLVTMASPITVTTADRIRGIPRRGGPAIGSVTGIASWLASLVKAENRSPRRRSSSASAFSIWF
jgi:hypothetical protein